MMLVVASVQAHLKKTDGDYDDDTDDAGGGELASPPQKKTDGDYDDGTDDDDDGGKPTEGISPR